MILPETYALLPEQFVVYLARHATPDRSRNDIPYTIPPGPELTSRGREEAAELGAYLLAAGARIVHASPLERTLRTARIAAEIARAEVEVNNDLAEWRGDEVEKDVTERVLRAFGEAAVLSSSGRQPVVLVTHGGPVLALLKALGVPTEAVDRCRIYDNRNPISPAGAWLVERDGSNLRIALVFTPTGYGLPSESNRRHLLTIDTEEVAITAD